MPPAAHSSPTIYALSTAPGKAGVAVIRISGPAARAALERMAPPAPEPRKVAFRTIRHPETAAVLDQAVVLFFASKSSETGEDVAELQLHGGRAVVRAVLDALSRLPGARLAEPGEFARRAFENGRIDLAAAEGLADLIDAETEGQRRQAILHASGAVSSLYTRWRQALIEASALVEAAIDFSDEGDVASDAFARAAAIVRDLEPAIRRHLDDGHRSEILRDGFRVALAGPPNAGKSSLLNALARRDAAIVSEEAGTTRDVIEVRLDLGGLPVIVADTAGIRATSSSVEQEGIRRTLVHAGDADLVLWLVDATDPQWSPPSDLLSGSPPLVVVNKIDLRATATSEDAVSISAETGVGIDSLIGRISSLAADRIGQLDEPAISQARHRVLLEDCHAALTLFVAANPAEVELRAEDLRRAAHCLGRVIGRVDVEDVLDQVFARFCIGK